MPLPSDKELIDGLLNAMQRLGGHSSVEEQEKEVIRLLELNKEDLAKIHEGSRTELNYRLAWARTFLKNHKLIQVVERGIWELTECGKNSTSINNLQDVDLEELDNLLGDSRGIEGTDLGIPEKFGEYPIDSVLIRSEGRSVYEVVRRIREGKYIMDPDFQRGFVWDVEKQSKLIESMLMRIPLPVFYLAEREDGKTVVVDGLQRLTTFQRFLDNELVMKDIKLAEELNGNNFSQLSLKLQNRVEDTQLILYLIDSKVPEQAKLDIFERVNGGVPLTRQQMRNALYCGIPTKWLKSESQTEEFLKATGGTLDSRTMRDRECINRYCAFRLLGADSYVRGDMDEFLANALKEMNRSSSDELELLSQEFRRSMRNNFTVFGLHAFRKHSQSSARRSVINVALFDIFSILLSKVSEDKINEMTDLIHYRFFNMMEDPSFVDAISLGTNSTRKVKARFEITQNLFKDLIPNAFDN